MLYKAWTNKSLASTTALAIRPGVVILSSDEIETILIDGTRSIPFIGSIYHKVMRLLEAPIIAYRLFDAFSSTREKVLARVALEKLIQEGAVVSSDVGRKNWMLIDHVLQVSDMASQPRVTLRAAGSFAARMLDVFSSILQSVGISVVAPTEISSDLDVLLVSSTSDLEEAMTSARQAAVPVMCAVDQMVVGPVLANPDCHWAEIKERVTGICQDMSAPTETACWPPPLQIFGLHWAALEILKCLSASAVRLSPNTYRSFRFSDVVVREHRISGIEAEHTCELGFDRSDLVRTRSSERSTGLRSLDDQTSLQKLLVVVDKPGGIIPYIQEVMTSPLHVCITLHNDGSHQRSRLGPQQGRIAASGKGYSHAAARISCIAEALERYSCGHRPSTKLILSSACDLTQSLVDPRQMLKFSKQQYERRSDAPPSLGFNWVPPKFEPSEVIGWTEGVDLTSGQKALLPAALIFFGYERLGEHKYGVADSNGCAAGATIEEAVLHGLLELIERDACAIWWYNRTKKIGIPLEEISDPALQEVVRQLRARGRIVYLLDLTTDLGVPVCACVSADASGKNIHLGLGASLSLDGAVRRAVAEMVQVGVVDVNAMPDTPSDPIQRDVLSWYKDADLENHDYLIPLDVKRPDSPRAVTENVAQSLASLLDLFERKALKVYALNMSRKGLPVKVARVVVPELRHFWQRLAPGRLYDVPVQMGWLTCPHREEELNETPFFL